VSPRSDPGNCRVLALSADETGGSNGESPVLHSDAVDQDALTLCGASPRVP